MARITIKDLPVAENLTPEQEELIQGAGPRSFRPTFEALEGREMMDAGFGHVLQLPVALPAFGGADPGGHVPMLDTSAPGATQAPRAALLQANLDQMFAALGRQGLPQGVQQAPSVQADSQHVEDVARAVLKDHIIGNGLANGRLSNRWALSNRVELAGKEVNGDQIKLTYNVWYGTQGDPCQVTFTFQGKNT